MRGFAYGVLDPAGERHALAQAHGAECPACRAYVLSLRGLAVVLPPAPCMLHALLGSGAAAGAAAASATILMSNHSEFDSAVTKIKMMAARKAGEPHPFELGAEAVQRYFKVMDECAQVARLKLLQQKT